MSPRLRSIVPHTLLLLLALLLFRAASTIDASVASGSAGFGPAAWPKFVIAMLALLCIVEIVRRLVTRKAADDATLLQSLPGGPPGSELDMPDGAADAPADSHPARLAAGLVLIFGFVVTVPYLGFFLSTALFLAAFIRVGGLRRPLVAAGAGVAGALVLVVVFMRIAYVSLPLGAGPFKDLSIGLLKLLGA